MPLYAVHPRRGPMASPNSRRRKAASGTHRDHDAFAVGHKRLQEHPPHVVRKHGHQQQGRDLHAVQQLGVFAKDSAR